MKPSTKKRPLADPEEFSGSPASRKAVQERLARLQARRLRESKELVRKARELRQILIKEVRSSCVR